MTEVADKIAQIVMDMEDIKERKKIAMQGYTATLKDLQSQLKDALHEHETGQKRIGA